MKGGKSKRSAETESEETDDAKRKKVEQPAGNLLVSNCSSEVGSLGYLVTNLVKNFVTNLVMNLVNHRIW